MVQVLLDTNFLLMPHQHGIDIFSEIDRLITEKHSIITLSPVIGELKHLAETSEDRVAAKVGLMLVADKKVEVIQSEGQADDAIVEYAKEKQAIVCTNDRELKARLKDASVKTVYMRGKKRLGMD